MHVLQRQGHTVNTAENGQQAIELLENDPFDLMLLDIVMPTMNGYEVLEKMKQTGLLRDVPVIVISALEETDSIVRCIEMGAEDYLTKPFDPVLLRARIGASSYRPNRRSQKTYSSIFFPNQLPIVLNRARASSPIVLPM
jgi:DNA-binding response OmpR family regulator